MSFTFELGISSADAIQLYPEYDFKDTNPIIEQRHRTLSGKLYNYRWADYDHFEFSLQYVSRSNASIINSWYNSRAELLFFVNSGGSTDVYSVMIMNDNNPLEKFNKPYDSYMGGKLILESY